MSWVPPRAVRRTVIDPLWLPVAVALAVLLGVVMLLAALVAPFSRKRRLLRLSVFAAVYLYLDVSLLLVALWYWLRSPRGHRDRRRWLAQHSELLGWALSRLIDLARRLFGYQIELVGRDLHLAAHNSDSAADNGAGDNSAADNSAADNSAADNALVVLARHAGPGDSFTLVHLLITRFQRNPRVVLKRALQWDPGLDVILSRLNCYFLPSKSGAGEDQAAAVAGMVAQLTPDDALLLFPEGGNWTPRRHRRSVLRLLRAGQRERARKVRERSHVLPPRSGGTSAALSVRRDTDVLVIAHTGLDVLVNPRQMWEALPLDDRPMRIRGWLHRCDEVPREDPAISEWLDEQWAQVDQWIGTQQRRG